MTRSLQTASFAGGIVLLALASEASAQAMTCSQEALRTLAPPVAPPSEASMSPQLFSVFGETPKGVGHLHPANVEDFVRRWDSRIVLPVFPEPTADQTPLGWIMEGYLVRPGGGTSSLPAIALRVQVSPEAPSYLVQEQRPDGWLALRINRSETSVWWTHQCLLDLGEVPLAYTSMVDALEADLYLDVPGVHVLRSGPSASAAEVTSFLGGLGNHVMTRLEIEGEWMRVRLEVHGYRCAGEAPWEGVETWEGWLQWRGADGFPALASIASIC